MTGTLRFVSLILVGLVIGMAAVRTANTFDDPPGLIIEEVVADSPAAKAGLKIGDRLLSYDDRPLSSQAALLAAQQSGDVKKRGTLQVRRGEVMLMLTVPTGRLGISVRPDLPTRALALYTEGRTAEQARQLEAAVSSWKLAATAARKNKDKAAAIWLYERIGEAYEGQKKWKEAQEMYETGWKLMEGSDDAAAQARMLEGLGRCSQNLKDYAAAERWFVQALQVNTTAGNKIWAADVATSLGTLAWSRRNLKVAQDYYSRALAIQERLIPDSLDVARNLVNLGNVAASRGDLQAAQAHYSRALNIQERLAPDSLNVAGSLNSLGNVARFRGDLQTAQDYYIRALAIKERLAPDSLNVALTLNNLGLVAQLRGDLQTTQDYHHKALAIRERDAPDSLDVAASLNNLGVVAQLRGDLQTAQDYYRRALMIKAREAPDSLDVAGSLANLGLIARSRGDLQAAQDYLRRALVIKERRAPDSLTFSSSLDNLGIVARLRGDLQAAQDYHRRALVIRERDARDSIDVAGSLTNLGLVAQSRGDLQTAQGYYHRALAIKERVAPGSLAVSISLYNLGNVSRLHGDLQAAKDFFRRALSIQEQMAPDSLDVAFTLDNLSCIAFDENRLSEALNLSSRAVEIVEAQRSKIFSPESRALFAEGHQPIYMSLLRAHLALNDLPTAFATVERARARSLVELLTERRIDFRAVAPAALLQQQEELNRDRSSSYYALQSDSLKQKAAQTELENLGDNKSPQQAKQLEERIDDFEEQIDIQKKQLAIYSIKQRELDASIRETSPKYASLKYPTPLKLEGAQAALDPGTLLLSYFVTDKQTYLFAVTKADLKVFTLPIGEKALKDQVQAFRDEVSTLWPDIDSAWRLKQATTAGKQLYDFLIRPAQQQVDQANRILICSDGPLHLLPFAALVSQTEPSLRYFIEDKPLHTIVSMTVYAETRQVSSVNEQVRPKRMLAFGDPVYSKRQKEEAGARVQLSRQAVETGSKKKAIVDRDVESSELQRRGLSLKPLPGTRKEVLEIRKMYGRSATIKLGAEATEAMAKQAGKGYAILHFGAHGLLDEQNGLDSALALSQPEALGRQATKEDNGYLQAWEIFEKVKLKADLVVLSACETGDGQKMRGEGLIGLTRAFQYAGAKSIVVSLWGVSDESTSTLMSAFYRELYNGGSKDVGLQRAMAVIRNSQNNPRWRHPYYWAPFVLTGDWQ